jgi:hypothetical protein
MSDMHGPPLLIGFSPGALVLRRKQQGAPSLRGFTHRFPGIE